MARRNTLIRSLASKLGIGAALGATLLLAACGTTSTSGGTTSTSGLLSCTASVADLTAGTGGHGAGGTKDATLAGKKISASGSSALQPLIKDVAAEFDTVQGTQSSIGAGGSGAGLTAVSQKAVDIGMSDIFASEKSGIDQNALADHQVAAVAFTMIVNNDLQGKVGNLTTDQITKIFTGVASNWSEFGGPTEPITAVIRPTGSGTRATFKKYVLNNADDTAGTAVSQDNTGAVVAAVKATPGAIGYVASGFVTGANSGDATPICIDGYKATATDINAGNYKFWGIEHAYTNGPATGAAKALLQYTLSDDVQKNDVPRLNFYPLSAISASAKAAHTPSGAPAPETLS
jgi:phosphate transport system substrate-binding protein